VIAAKIAATTPQENVKAVQQKMSIFMPALEK